VQHHRIRHEPALDGLRGAAIAAVLLFHAGHVRGGYLGVDLFFTLSGFLITSLLLAEITSTGGIRLGAFWARRARRLLPALAVLLIAVALYAHFVAATNELDRIRWDGIWTMLYAANWREVFGHADYWAMFSAPSPLQHTWSLAIEEQFYLVWPLVMLVVARRARDVARTTAIVAATLAVVGSAWLILSYNPADPSRSYYGTDTRIAAIAFGALLAALVAWHGGRAISVGVQRSIQVFGWAGAATILVMWKTLDGTSDLLYRGGLTVAAISATCVIAAVITRRDGLLARGLSFGPLRALGLISYGAYLYHWPIFVYFDEARTHATGWALTAVRIALTLVAASLSYVFVEQPILRGDFARRARSMTGFVATVVGAAVAVALVASTAGARPIIDPAALDDTATATAAAHRAPPGTHRLMLAGSSIAAELAGPLRATPFAGQMIVLNRAVVGCAFPDHIARREWPGEPNARFADQSCGASWQHDVATFAPDAVLYIPGAEPGTVRYEFAGTRQFVGACTTPFLREYRADLRRHIATLSRQGTTVYLATFAYSGLPFMPDGWDHATDCVNTIIRSVGSSTTGVHTIDLFAYMCSGGHCRLDAHGVPIRPDGTHYSGRGAEPVAEWILRQMHLT
jgi:peptidoglycan/LPS O-acetylase OafA/YrhL